MKHDITKPNIPRFARDLVKNFGRVKAKEVCEFLMENPNSDEQIVSIGKRSLEYLESESNRISQNMLDMLVDIHRKKVNGECLTEMEELIWKDNAYPDMVRDITDHRAKQMRNENQKIQKALHREINND